MSIQPIVRTVAVKLPPARAFDLFASRMGDWWPRGRTVGKQPHVEIVLEPHAGGRFFERDAEGAEVRWGTVLAWRPPHRLLLAWSLDRRFEYDPSLVTEVEVTFDDAPDGGTIVRLEHRDLEKFGADADRMAASLGEGWASRLADYAAPLHHVLKAEENFDVRLRRPQHPGQPLWPRRPGNPRGEGRAISLQRRHAGNPESRAAPVAPPVRQDSPCSSMATSGSTRRKPFCAISTASCRRRRSRRRNRARRP